MTWEGWVIFAGIALLVIAFIVFMWYDMMADTRKPKQSRHDAGLHHAAHNGCLGHPPGCEHMMTPERRKQFEEELNG